MTPSVSVIIPCYNGKQFIAEAIDCILAQTLKDFEIVIVDDGSTDNSKVVVERIADKRIRLIAHPENRGIAAARNTGIRNASAPFIAFLDQDDLWRPDKLAKQVAAFEADLSGEVGLVFSDREVVVMGHMRGTRSFKGVPRGLNNMSRVEVLGVLYRRNCIPMSSILVRRDCFDTIGFLNEDIRSGVDDYEFYTRLIPKCRVVHIAEPLVIRREHDSNYTDDEKLVPDAIKINRQLVESFPELSRFQSRRESELLFKLGRALQGKGDRVRAKAAYRSSIRIRPQYIKPLLALVLCSLGGAGNVVLDGWNRLRSRVG